LLANGWTFPSINHAALNDVSFRAFAESQMKEARPISDSIRFWDVTEIRAYPIANNDVHIELWVYHISPEIKRTSFKKYRKKGWNSQYFVSCTGYLAQISQNFQDLIVFHWIPQTKFWMNYRMTVRDGSSPEWIRIAVSSLNVL
jgi:hypothetical protein